MNTALEPKPYFTTYTSATDDAKAVRLAKSLGQPFQTKDIAAQCYGCDHATARKACERWVKRGWLVPVAWGLYRRSETFGGKIVRLNGNRWKPIEQDPVHSNEQFQPCDSDGIALSNTLPVLFSALDLQARLDGNSRDRAANWLNVWYARGWLEVVTFGCYRRTERFGI